MANNYVMHLNSGEIYMIFCAIVIIQSGWYPVFIIKSNQNNIMSVGMYLSKELS